MGVRIVRIATAALLVALCAGLASADTMVVAGQRMPSPTPFVVAGEEVYAPLLSALAPLRAGSVVSSEQIVISTAGGRQIAIQRARPEATVDGELHPLPSVPRAQGDTLLLPAQAVGRLLGCAVHWNEASRTLSLVPLIRTFTVEVTPDRYRITVAGEQPLSYRTTKLQGPPRLVVDFSHTELAEAFAPYKVENSYLRAVRIAQHALAPDPKGDVTRVVVDVSEWHDYRLRLSEDKCRLQVEWPLPDRALPSDAPAVTLSDCTFRRVSPQTGVLVLTASGKAKVTSGTTADPPAVWVDVENATDHISPERLTIADSLITRVTLAPLPEHPGVQRLTVTLSENTPSVVSSQDGEVRLLLGKCELSNLTIAVDAGHGGSDAGAIGRSGLREKEVTLDIALRVGQLLQEAGAKVIYTRCEDTIVKPLEGSGNGSRVDQLYARCDIANNVPADLFVSVHCNSRARDTRAIRGTETYYRKLDSIPFARVMQEEVVRALGLPDRGALFHPRSIVVLYRTHMPAVLVEVAYLSNPSDEALLSDSGFRERAAQGIANGVKRYAAESGLLLNLLHHDDSQPPPSAPAEAPVAPQ